MTWHIPAWYRGPLSKTPYSELNRWRLWPRVLMYCLYAPQAIVLITFAFIPSKRVAVCMLWLRDISRQSIYVEGLITICGLSLLLWGPAFACLMLARALKKRQLDRLQGRCLNCGERRASEFLEDCSKCNSQFKEQDQYRIVAATQLLRRRPIGVRQPVAALRQSFRTAAVVSLISIGLMVACGRWMAHVEEGLRPPIPMSLARAAFMLSIFGILPPGIMLARWDFRRVTHHLLRLKGRCMQCETQLDENDIVCRQCRSSIIAQQLWVRQILFQFQGTAPQKVMEIAGDLGIPIPNGSGKS